MVVTPTTSFPDFSSLKRFYLGSHHSENRLSHRTSLFATIFTMISVKTCQITSIFAFIFSDHHLVLSIVSLLLLSFILTRHVHYAELARTSRVLPHTKAVVAFNSQTASDPIYFPVGEKPLRSMSKGNVQKTWPLVYG